MPFILHSEFYIFHCLHCHLEYTDAATILRLNSPDGTNRLTRDCVVALTCQIEDLTRNPRSLIIAGNSKFFSAGADLSEIAALTGPAAYDFSRMGQELMNLIADFPARTIAAIAGYCMGGGVDLALACDWRIASPHAIFAHRGSALGLITGWGGTQRLPRLIGKPRAMKMLVEAEKLHAQEALRIGLVDAIADDPVNAAMQQLGDRG